jgi:hypothetical protein
MHNPRMVDPEFEINREIKAISSKRKKTDADHQRMEMLEWFGGLYEEDGQLVQPVAKVRKCLIEAARIHKLGKSVERALILDGITTPLQYEGPRDPAEIYATGNGYVSRLSVVVGGKRIMRARPQFMPWGLKIDGTLLDDAGLNFDELERIADLAGRAIGIGDNRVNGYGRFEVEVKPA